MSDSTSRPPEPPPVRRDPRPAAPPLRQEVRALVGLALPLVGAQLATVAMNFVDVIMAGRLGAAALAAVAVGGSVFSSVMVFSLGVLMAVPPSVSHLVGAGRTREVGRVARQALWLALVLAAGSAALMANARPLLEAIGVQPEIVPTALGYLRALAWGMPALYGYLVLRFFSEGLAHTRPALYIGLLGLAVNALGNWVLMYGRWGAPALGAVGCGYATAIVFWCEVAAMAAYVAVRPRYAEARLFAGPEPPAARDLADLLRIGVPIGVALFLEVSLFAVVSLLMASLGTVVVASHQVAINFASLTFMVPLGIAMAITVRVGHAAGRRDPGAARRAGWTGIGLALTLQAAAALVMLLFPHRVAAFYTRDPQVLSLASRLLILAGVFQFSDGLQAAAAGALRGLKDTRWPMAITFLAYWVIALPLGCWLAFRREMGPRGLWIGFIAGLTVAAGLLTGRFGALGRRG